MLLRPSRVVPALLLLLATPALAAPPLADAGPDQVIECGGPAGVQVMLDGSASSDPDGDPLSYTWTDAALPPNVLATDATPTVTLPTGTHVLTLTVDDGAGGTASDTVTITVNPDATPPTLGLAETSDELWPPNHELHGYDASALVASVSDDCADLSAADVFFAHGTSDEPDDEQGDGRTSGDVQLSDACDEAAVRAERAGPEDGRVYRLWLRVEDEAGNYDEEPFEVTVPHDRAGPAVDDGDTPLEVECGARCDPAPDPNCADAGPAEVRIASGKKGAKLRWRASGFAAGEVDDAGHRLCAYAGDAPAGAPRAGKLKAKVKAKRGQGALAVASRGRGVALPLAPGAALRLELHDRGGQCVASSFEAPSVNEAGRYRAETP